MARLDEILDVIKHSEIEKKKEDKKNCLFWILAAIGAVAAVAAIAYAVYRYLTPNYLEDFDDDFEDEDMEEEPAEEAVPAENKTEDAE